MQPYGAPQQPQYGSYPPPTGYLPQGYPIQGYPVMQPVYGAPPPAQDMPQPIYIQQQPIMVVEQELIMVPNQNQTGYPISANGVPHPAQIYCSICQKNVTTVVEDKAGSGTWTWCFILALLTPGCCCFPFCISSCQDKLHTCPGCQNQVGFYEYNVC
ncbi:hypothetical protein ABPG72_015250 [Tetrahymena utriculariae]